MELPLFTLYALLLAGVCAILLGMLLEAVIHVSRKPKWGSPRQKLALVHVEDRRQVQLPFVGVDRRVANAAAAQSEERKRA